MKNPLRDNSRLRIASQYIAAVVLCGLILCVVLSLWRADLRVPLHYNGDALLHAMFIRGVVDNGWYLQNPSIGAPQGLKMYDFPAVDNAAVIVLWLISLLTPNTIVVMNVFYLLTFPLTTISSLFVLQRLNLSYASSLISSLLYTFLPYHFMRDESHLFLSAYYFVPLVVMVLLWVMADKLRLIPSIIVCVLIGSAGVYYPFFSCFLMLVAGLSGALNQRRFRPLASAAMLIAITFAVLVINLSPTLVYLYKNGDAKVTERNPVGVEIYGLKISQLLLPVTGHRIPQLNRLKSSYNENIELTESDAATLGLIGSLGFVGLLGLLLYRRRDDEQMTSSRAILSDLSILNIFALLLGTVGGISALFALIVSAGIRSYNRISVFIAFFSFIVLAIALDFIYRWRVKNSRSRIVFYASLAFLLGVGIFDQTTRAFVPDYGGVKTEWKNDDDFISQIESSVPQGAMIFQLPYVPFPEHPRMNKMVDYDHFRGYLHSKNLRWSYGAMKNRDGDLWQRQVAGLPIDELVRALGFAGFAGIYLDRRGYEDNGAAQEMMLSNAVGAQPMVSRNGRLVFFNLTDYDNRLRARYSESEWQIKKEAILHPIRLNWVGGFSGLEVGPDKTWRWCSNEGELHVQNVSQRAREISLEMSFATGHRWFDALIISGPLLSDQVRVNENPSFYSRTVTVPPGESVIKFASTAQRVEAPLDPRVLVFRIENFKMKELE
jgi:phosphoglycerol transferase